ncbi:MAG: helix-turn-helix domain-containing protein [Oscillospiraceae bacterium]|nr:helix-turn-helix domain-containing protein [Oscillospiraceae bacterium]
MLAQRLKQLRAEKGINQIELAQKMGVTQGTVGKWETEKRVPDVEMLHKLAAYFSVPIDFLLGPDTGLILLARNLSGIPEKERDELINVFNSTMENYLKNKGIKND